MSFLRWALHGSVLLAAPILATPAAHQAQTTTTNPAASAPKNGPVVPTSYPAALVESGRSLFRQECSFCHGREAGGGEGGPDLTRSKLVTEDVDGDKIGPVARNGRPDKGMPSFELSDQQIASLVAFIHTQQNTALTKTGGRKEVDASDLQSGKLEAGNRCFEGAGGCAACHSPNGDLAGIASRHKGLELEERMLYPKHAKSKGVGTLASGQTINGTLE